MYREEEYFAKVTYAGVGARWRVFTPLVDTCCEWHVRRNGRKVLPSIARGNRDRKIFVSY